MRLLTMFVGVLCLTIVFLDAFQTIILPRRAAGHIRLTRIFYILTWNPWVFFARRITNSRKQETALSFYGPLSLIFLLMVWACGMVFGFSLIYFSLGSPFNDPSRGIPYLTDLYVSGTNFFTLGLGDVTPHSELARVLSILEAGTGFGFLAVVMGYFPGPVHGVFAPGSQHLAPRRKSRISSHGRRTDAPSFVSGRRAGLVAAIV